MYAWPEGSTLCWPQSLQIDICMWWVVTSWLIMQLALLPPLMSDNINYLQVCWCLSESII